MHPILFNIGRFPVYTYGVLLAAAYLLGLQFALVRARKRGLDPNRVMDLGIWIIISALAGGCFSSYRVSIRSAQSRELLTSWSGVFYGGLIAAVSSRSGISGAIECRCDRTGRARRHRPAARDAWVLLCRGCFAA
jgi:prolipoprotein diacylglyceryltransferase